VSSNPEEPTSVRLVFERSEQPHPWQERIDLPMYLGTAESVTGFDERNF
jgi:hypothetical protein